MSISLPDSDAFPDNPRRASTRCSFLFVCSLRALTASGANFFSRAAALRATCSTRRSGAAPARISSALAASARLRLRVYIAIQANASRPRRSSLLAMLEQGSSERVVRSIASSIRWPASARVVTSSNASSSPGNPPGRQPTGMPRLAASSNAAWRRRPNPAVISTCLYCSRAIWRRVAWSTPVSSLSDRRSRSTTASSVSPTRNGPGGKTSASSPWPKRGRHGAQDSRSWASDLPSSSSRVPRTRVRRHSRRPACHLTVHPRHVFGPVRVNVRDVSRQRAEAGLLVVARPYVGPPFRTILTEMLYTRTSYRVCPTFHRYHTTGK